MKDAWQLTREMFLNAGETHRLLTHVRGRCKGTTGRALVSAQLDQVIIEGLLFSGLRTTEFCRLTLADTVLGHAQSVLVIQGLKGRDRTVYVPTHVSDLVKRYVAETRPALLPAEMEAGDLAGPLIFGERRKPLERTGLYRRVVRVLTAADLGARASVQLLRHTYGYLAYTRTGGNLLFVQRQLGHAHPMITAIYAQFADESYEHMAEQIGE